jgi:CheY-like chemotaxis protein
MTEKPRVLVVEDNPDNMLLFQDVLQALNYTVIQARDGETGVQTAKAEKPNLILMDLSLPRMDGWTAAGHIKADPELQHIPIIALTAHAMVGDRERALAAGCDDYLAKPINLREFREKVSRYMNQ